MNSLDLSKITIQLESSNNEKRNVGTMCTLENIEVELLKSKVERLAEENNDLKVELEQEKSRIDSIIRKIINSSNIDFNINHFLDVLDKKEAKYAEFVDDQPAQPTQTSEYIFTHLDIKITENILKELKTTHQEEVANLKKHYKTELARKNDTLNKLSDRLKHVSYNSFECDNCALICLERNGLEEELSNLKKQLAVQTKDLEALQQRNEEIEGEHEYYKWMKDREINLLKNQISNFGLEEYEQAIRNLHLELEKGEKEKRVLIENIEDLKDRLEKAEKTEFVADNVSLKEQLNKVVENYEAKLESMDCKWERYLAREKADNKMKIAEMEERYVTQIDIIKADNSIKYNKLVEFSQRMADENKALASEYFNGSEREFKLKLQEMTEYNDKCLLNLKEYNEEEKELLKKKISSLEKQLARKQINRYVSSVESQEQKQKHFQGCLKV